jgi:hypothetical protein
LGIHRRAAIFTVGLSGSPAMKLSVILLSVVASSILLFSCS